jgi:hypothetical protein
MGRNGSSEWRAADIQVHPLIGRMRRLGSVSHGRGSEWFLPQQDRRFFW